jgi:hypothetical protein
VRSDTVQVPTGLGTPQPWLPSLPLVGDMDGRQLGAFVVLTLIPLFIFPNVLDSFGMALLLWVPFAFVGFVLARWRPRGLWLGYWVWTWCCVWWELASARFNSHTIYDDGTLELPGIRLGRWHLWGGPRFRMAVEVRPQTALELLDVDARAAVLQRIQALLLSCTYPISVYLRTRPQSPRRLAEVAGPAAEWAANVQALTLVERRLLILVSAADRATVQRRQRELLRWLESADMVGVPLDGVEVKNTLSDVLGGFWSDTSVEETNDTATIDGKPYASYIVQRCPRIAALGWLGTLTAGDVPADVALHASPLLSRREGIARIDGRLRWWKAAAHVSDDSNYHDAVADGERVKDGLRHQDRLWDVSLYVSAPLEKAVATELALTESLADWRPATLCQATVRRDTLPFGDDHAQQRFELDTPSLAVTAPLASGGLRMPGGALIGVSGVAPEAIVYNPFDPRLGNWSIVVLGMMGSGKSLLLKILIERLARARPGHWLYEAGVEVLTADAKPEGEYRVLIEGLGGRYESLPTSGRIVLDGHTGYNMAHIPREERGATLRAFTWAVWERAQQDGARKRPRILIVDEAWMLAQTEKGAEFLEEFGRLSRSAYLCSCFSSQQAGDFVRSDAAKAVVRNAGTRILLRQTEEEVVDVATALHLSAPAQELLMRAGDGQGIWRIGPRQVLPVQVVPTEDELVRFETNPQYELVEGRRTLPAGLVA